MTLKINEYPADLLQDISALIEASRQHVARVANSTLTLLFWQVGKRINDEILKNERAEYGKQIVSFLSDQLEVRYGRNFSERNVRRMVQFSIDFSDFAIVSPLATQLSWSHFIELFSLKSMESKLYYAQNAIEQRWGSESYTIKLLEKHLNGTKLQIVR